MGSVGERKGAAYLTWWLVVSAWNYYYNKAQQAKVIACFGPDPEAFEIHGKTAIDFSGL